MPIKNNVHYKIKNKRSNLFMGIDDFSPNSGGTARQWDKDEHQDRKAEFYRSTTWELIPLENGFFRIVNSLGGCALGIDDFSDSNGATARQWLAKEFRYRRHEEWNESTQWKINNGKIQNKRSGLYLAISSFSTSDGGVVKQYDDKKYSDRIEFEESSSWDLEEDSSIISGLNRFPERFSPNYTERTIYFKRGTIPRVDEKLKNSGEANANSGGPHYEEAYGHKFEHIQSIACVGDWSKGAAYIVATHSQDNFGWMLVFKTNAVMAPPNEHIITSGGEGVWWRRFDLSAYGTDENGNELEGIYNHPGDVSIVDNVLVCAAQNWAGRKKFPKVTLNRYDESDGKYAKDAILFYDFSNPESPRYMGKRTISYFNEILNPEQDKIASADTATITKVASGYYLLVGAKKNNYWFKCDEGDLGPEREWTQVKYSDTDDLYPTSGLNLSIESYSDKDWGFRGGVYYFPKTESYKIEKVTQKGKNNELQFGPSEYQFFLRTNGIKPGQAEHGIYLSKNNYLTKLTCEAGFSTGGSDTLEMQCHSNKYD